MTKIMEAFRSKYPNGKIDVTCNVENETTYVTIKAFAKHDDAEHIAQFKTICYHTAPIVSKEDKLKSTIDDAITRCMCFAGIIVNDKPVTENTTVETVVPEVEKPKRGRKPKKEMPMETTEQEVKETEKEETIIENKEDDTVGASKTVAETEPVETAKVVDSDADAETTETTTVAEVETTPSNVVYITTMEEAKSYEIPFGQHKGRFVGELLAIDKKVVEYYADRYKGTDVNLRAAARIVLGLDKACDF